MSSTAPTETYIVVLHDGVVRSQFISLLTTDIKENSSITFEYEHVLNGFVGKFRESDIELLKEHPDVKSIEKDSVGSACVIQADAPWGLRRLCFLAPFDLSDKPTPSKYMYHYDVAAGAGVDIYIVDSGIDTAHPQFENRASWGTTIVGTPNKDISGHGTHIAGTAISKRFGVAKASKAISVKVMEKTDYFASDLIKGMDWILQNVKKTKRPSVVNISLGGAPSDAVDSSVKTLFDQLIPVVVGAGNEKKNAKGVSPARSPYAITVGASNIRDKMWEWSNYGEVINIFAPGVDVESTWPDGKTKVESGTSTATPYVTGLLAYLISLQNKVPSNFWVYNRSGVLRNIPSKTTGLLIYNNHYQIDG